MARNVLNNMQVIALHQWMQEHYITANILENYAAYALDASNALGFQVSDGHVNRMRQDMGRPSIADMRTQREEEQKAKDKALLETSGKLAATVLAQQVEIDALKERVSVLEGFVRSTFPNYIRDHEKLAYTTRAVQNTLASETPQ